MGMESTGCCCSGAKPTAQGENSKGWNIKYLVEVITLAAL